MEQSSAARRKSLVALFLANILAKPILNKKKKYPKYNKVDNFPNWGEDTHKRAAAGRDGWDEDWFPHETF
jgi:hypothetical protein